MDYQDVFESLVVSTTPHAEKSLYAHELGQEMLVSYLSRTSGENINQHFSQTFNSIVKLATSAESSKRIIELSNGWSIVSRVDYLDHDTQTIAITTAMSTNRIIELRKAGPDHPLFLELAIAALSYRGTVITPGSDWKFMIIAIDRLYTDYKVMPTQPINYIIPKEIYDYEAIEAQLIQYTDSLQHHIDSGTLPPKCTNLRFHRQKGKSVNMTCAHYCPVSYSCKYRSNYAATTAKINNIIF